MQQEKLIKLGQFLQLSGVSYHRYRRMRLRGLTPKETRLGPKTVLLKESDLRDWLSKAEREWQRQQQSPR
jgi:predicted DNA-binding transcriptional regulator AlpA